MNSDIEETVKNCTKCAEFQRKQPSEPLMPSQTPELPFSEVGTDLFEFECKTYLLTLTITQSLSKLTTSQTREVRQQLKPLKCL